MTTAFLPIKKTFQAQLFIKPIYFMALSPKDWELTDLQIRLAQIDNESGLDSPSRPVSSLCFAVKKLQNECKMIDYFHLTILFMEVPKKK